MNTTPTPPPTKRPIAVLTQPTPAAAHTAQRHDKSRRQHLVHQLSTTSPQQVLRRVGALTLAFIGVTAIVWHRRGPVGIDTFLLHGYVAQQHTALFIVSSIVTDLASPALVAILGTVIAGYLWRYRNDTARAIVCVGAPLVAGATEATLKIVVERLRPATGALTGEYGYSFPSGHTAGFAALAFAIALTARRQKGRATAIALLLSMAIAATRVIVGAHYPTDVLGGLLLGIAVAVPSTLLRALIKIFLEH